MSGSIQGPPVPVVAGTTAAQQMILTRFNDSLENVRREFDLFGQEVGVLRGQRDDFENKGEHTFVSGSSLTPCNDRGCALRLPAPDQRPRDLQFHILPRALAWNAHGNLAMFGKLLF